MVSNIEKLKGDKKIPFRIMVKRTFGYVKKEWLSFLFAAFLILLNVTLDIAFPLFMRDLTNNLQSPNISLQIILTIAIGYFILSVFSQVFAYLLAMILQKAGQRIVYGLRMEVFEHIENMSQNK